MNLEALLSGIFALGLPVWLLVEQVVHSLGHVWPSKPIHFLAKREPRALRRVA